MKTAIYIRVSTDEQAQEGYSIAAQKRKLLSYIDSQDWTLYDIFIDDGYSAKDLDRPEMQRMLDCINEVDVVLVYKLDRLTRSAADCDNLIKLFESKNVKFQSCTESFETRTAAGRLFIRLIADIAQWERETIAERVRFGMEQKVREGKRPGGKLPYGYSKDGELIEEEAEIIRCLRELYMFHNLSFKKIAEKLYFEGIKRRGKDWTANTVKLTLENPLYAGIIRFGSKRPDGRYVSRNIDDRVDCVYGESSLPTIWTKEQYKEHMELIKSRSVNGYSRQLNYWFSGLLKCGKCGASMFGRLTTKRSLKNGEIVRTAYYWCNNRKANGSCDMPMFRQSHVEYMVMNYIKQIILDDDLLAKMDAQKTFNAERKMKNISKVKRQLEEIKARRKKWQYMFANDLMTSEELKEVTAEEDERRNELLIELDSLSSEREKTSDIEQLRRAVINWDLYDDFDKQRILKTIFKQITLHTECSNVKGVKNKYFDANITVEYK